MTRVANNNNDSSLNRRTTVLLLLLCLLSSSPTSSFTIPVVVKNTSTIRNHKTITTTTTAPSTSTSTSTRLNAFWIFGSNKNKKNTDNNPFNNNNLPSSILPLTNTDNNNNNNNINEQQQQYATSSMATTASTMENFKQSQELGRRTNALLTDLTSSTIEGIGANGKVKVLVNGRQEPIGVEVDETYLKQVMGLGGSSGGVEEDGVEELNEALTVAMQDAWTKSMEVMEDKMQALYSELGLPSAKS